jgi:hypothetical protein
MLPNLSQQAGGEPTSPDTVTGITSKAVETYQGFIHAAQDTSRKPAHQGKWLWQSSCRRE